MIIFSGNFTQSPNKNVLKILKIEMSQSKFFSCLEKVTVWFYNAEMQPKDAFKGYGKCLLKKQSDQSLHSQRRPFVLMIRVFTVINKYLTNAINTNFGKASNLITTLI